MLENIHFSYDGLKSVDMGLWNCKIEGGMFEETFLPSRDIRETKVANNNKPYFQRLEYNPLDFNLTFAIIDKYDEKRIRDIARWLCQPYYKEFYTNDNPNRIFYCMYTGDTKLIHNGLKEGYITLNMRCDSSYSYTPKYKKDNLDFGLSKVAKKHEDNTFNSGMGIQKNIKINNDSSMSIESSAPRWSDFEGMKWSDIIDKDI